MNTPNSARRNGAAKTPPSEDGSRPISISVVIIIADVRKSSRVMEVGREESFAATPESFAALPNHLNSLVRGAGGDALLELNKFLKLLTQPEPPAEELPPASANPGQSMSAQAEPETPATEPMLELPAEPPSPVEDYLIPLALPLLS